MRWVSFDYVMVEPLIESITSRPESQVQEVQRLSGERQAFLCLISTIPEDLNTLIFQLDQAKLEAFQSYLGLRSVFS